MADCREKLHFISIQCAVAANPAKYRLQCMLDEGRKIIAFIRFRCFSRSQCYHPRKYVSLCECAMCVVRACCMFSFKLNLFIQSFRWMFLFVSIVMLPMLSIIMKRWISLKTYLYLHKHSGEEHNGLWQRLHVQIDCHLYDIRTN